MLLDMELKEQLVELFKNLTKPTFFVITNDSGEKGAELKQFLMEVASTNSLFNVKTSLDSNVYPSFYLEVEDFKNIYFTGIPSGHEFNSFILAILNSQNIGKMPDQALIKRIEKLPSMSLETFMSLSCENCPDVVQAINLIAIINKKIKHNVIDGAVAPDLVEKRKISGVPAVFLNDKMIVSGRSSFLEILNKIEDMNVSEQIVEYSDLGLFDVAVIGGGPAGVSSAIYSARKGLKTILITEKIGGQVTETLGIENFISINKTEGAILSNNMEKHLNDYDIKILEHRKVTKIEKKDNFNILMKNETLTAKKIIIATGAKWRKLKVEGEEQFLGRGVHFCPHCDGPFYKDKNVVVVGGGNSGVEAALDLSGIAKKVTVVEFLDKFKADQVLIDKMKNTKNIEYYLNSSVLKIEGNDKVNKITIKNRTDESLIDLTTDAVFIQIGLSPNTEFLKDFINLNKFGEIVVDEKNRTSVEGIYACGDVTNIPYKQIIMAMGDGAKASLAMFEDLLKK